MEARGDREMEKGFVFFFKMSTPFETFARKKATQFAVKGRGETVNSFNLPLFVWTVTADRGSDVINLNFSVDFIKG